MIKEIKAQNTHNYRIDNPERASNCQLNCFEYRAVFKSISPNELKTEKKESRAVYKTTDE